MPINASELTSQQQITAIYVAYYDRAPDPAGLDFWVSKLEGGRSLSLIASDFSSAAETTSKYPFFDDPEGSSANAFITSIYSNLFGRTPDSDGLDFWSGQLESGSTPVGEIILAILEGAQDAASGGFPDSETINNKIEAGLDWTASAAAAGIGVEGNLIAEEDADGNLVINDADAFNSATSLLDGVDGTEASVTAAKDATDTFIASTEYALNADSASVDEDGSASFTLQNAAPNTEFAYKVEGDGAVNEVATVTTDADGNATITVAVSDDVQAGGESITVSLIGEGFSATTSVNPVNDAPVLTDPAAALADGVEDTAYNVSAADLLQGFTDEEGDTLSVANLAADNGATVADNGDGTYTITPAADFNGAVTLSYEVTDGTAFTAATQTVDFAAVNDAPVAEDASLAVAEADASVTGQLDASDVDGDDLTFALDAAVEGLTLNADGSYTFDPSLNTDAQALTYTDDPLVIDASYTVTDSEGATDTKTLSITVDPTALSFELTPTSPTVKEGTTQTFTVTASEAVASDFDTTFTLSPDNGTGADTGTNDTNTNDFIAGAFNPSTVTIATGATEATFDVTPKDDGTTELPEGFTVTAEVDGETLNASGTVQDSPTQNFTLTTGIDDVADFTGTANNDTYTGLIDNNTAANTTFSALDEIDGKGGTDSFKVNVVGNLAAFPGATISNIETLNMRGSANITADLTGQSFSTVNVTKGVNVDIDAATTADVNYSGLTGTLDIDGGKNIDVTDETADKAIEIGANTVNDGTITVTDSNKGNATIDVDGGTDVTVTASGDTGTGAIKVGDTTEATGAVTVSNTAADRNDNNDLTMGAVTVDGGTSVNVTTSAGSTDASEFATGTTVTQSDVTVTGDASTTSVSVSQTASAAEKTYTAAVDGIKQTKVVTFVDMKSGEDVTVDGLKFTASKDLTAAEAAAAFANLSASDTQDDGGPIANGVYTNNTSANWTSGAADGAKVTFTEVTAATANTALAVSDNVAGGNISVANGVTGKTAVTGSTGELGVINGAVVIDDTADNTITTVSVDGYGDGSAIGATAAASTLGSLETVTLANSGGTNAGDQDATMDIDAAGVAALTLNADNIQGTVDIDEAADSAIKTLTLNATGTKSKFGLEADGVETLTVDAAVDLDVGTGSTLTSVETVTVSGAGAVDLGDISGTATSVTATDSAGGVTTTIDGTKATFSGGSGADDVTLDTTAPTKAISLGGGDDKLTLASGTTTSTGTLSGGAGTADTLHMDAADAETASGATTFETKIDGFEKLSLGQVAAGATETINLDNMDDISYVKSAGGGAAVKEVFTATFVGTEVGADTTVTFDNVTVTLAANTGGTAIAGDYVTKYNNDAAGSYTAVDNNDGTVTFTADTAKDINDVAPADFVVNDAGSNDTTTVDVTNTTVDTQGKDAGALTLNNMEDDGTLELTDSSSSNATVTMKDATGGADSLNVKLQTEDSTTFGTVTVNDVETVSVDADDLDTDENGDGKATLTLDADSAETVNVSGDADVDLTVSSTSSLATVDASAMTGGLTYTADDGTTTVTGGSGGDKLTASGSGDTLKGGAGDDTLTGASLTEMYGGDGADTFVFDADDNAPTNVNSYSTIMDLSSGDIIDFDSTDTGTVEFSQTATTLAGTAVFQDYANAAVNGLGTDTDDAAWFQYDGDTYIVQSGDAGATNDFVNGTDSIIKIVGTVDLSTASYNQTDGTLEIA